MQSVLTTTEMRAVDTPAIASTPLELVPMARKIPISVRRRTTLTAIVL